MTEAIWLKCVDPATMLVQRGSISDRQLILFACACCRRQWHLLPDESCRTAVALAERFVDGLCSAEELGMARQRIEAEHPNLYWPECCGSHAALAAYFGAFDAGAADAFEAEHPLGGQFDNMLAALKDEVAVLVAVACSGPEREQDFAKERAAQCVVLRDILGNPFRQAALEPIWLAWTGGTVVKLAQGIYEERAFDRLPVLADALEEAGCHDNDILGHCCHPGPHVRGCWVVDLLTGRN